MPGNPAPRQGPEPVSRARNAELRKELRAVHPLTEHEGADIPLALSQGFAKVAELADALDSGSSGVKLVEVRVLSFAQR
jgi:hypothetical protein